MCKLYLEHINENSKERITKETIWLNIKFSFTVQLALGRAFNERISEIIQRENNISEEQKYDKEVERDKTLPQRNYF